MKPTSAKLFHIVSMTLACVLTAAVPTANAQEDSPSLEVPLNTPSLQFPGNRQVENARMRLSPLNLNFSKCTPAPGSFCQPADHWFRDSLLTHTVAWYAGGFLTPGAAVIAANPTTYSPNAFGAFGQCVSVASVRGGAITLTGYVAANHVYYGYAGLWVRIDDAFGNAIYLDNMNGRGLSGLAGYTQLAVGAYIPYNADKICYGGLLTGTGAAYFDDFTLYYN